MSRLIIHTVKKHALKRLDEYIKGLEKSQANPDRYIDLFNTGLVLPLDDLKKATAKALKSLIKYHQF